MIGLKDENFYTATMIEKGKREFVVFEYRCNTFHVTGRTPFSLDQKFVEFENVRPIGSKEFLARDS